MLFRYTVPEVQLFFEKAVRKEMQAQAQFIDGVVAGIGGALGGKEAYKALQPMLKQLRGEA